MLWRQERVDFREIRIEHWTRKLHTADNETKVVSAEAFRTRLKMFKRGDTKNVISSCCAQKCDVLSRVISTRKNRTTSSSSRNT